MSIKVTVIIQKEENRYVSKCLENNVASQGKTIEEAMKNLKEAIELYYEDEKPDFKENDPLITMMEVAI
jgi:predicted RNase H-like HicB family nuclease